MYTIYHNPRCTKSREALALLEASGVPLTVIRYLETPPDAGTVSDLLGKLGVTVRGLLRIRLRAPSSSSPTPSGSLSRATRSS